MLAPRPRTMSTTGSQIVLPDHALSASFTATRRESGFPVSRPFQPGMSSLARSGWRIQSTRSNEPRAPPAPRASVGLSQRAAAGHALPAGIATWCPTIHASPVGAPSQPTASSKTASGMGGPPASFVAETGARPDIAARDSRNRATTQAARRPLPRRSIVDIPQLNGVPGDPIRRASPQGRKS